MPAKKDKQEPKQPTRKDKVQEVIAALNKEYGRGIVLTNEKLPDIEKISSGCYSLDKGLGGGWARGRIVEILGMESSGKSTVCLEAIASVQRAGGLALFVDAEHAFDGVYAKNLGVNVDELIFSQPPHGEAALDVADAFARSGIVDLMVIDSVAALVPKAEIEAGMSEQQMGLHPRLMSKAMRLLTGPLSKGGVTLMFTNQYRDKISMWSGGKTSTGGNALRFYTSQRLELRRLSGEKGIVKVNGEPVAIEVNAKVIKNKVAPPFKETALRIVYGKGIDKELDLVRAAIEKGVVDKSGAWYSYGEHKIQGESTFCDILLEDRKLYKRVIDQLNACG
jgi:recombination protein RecA